MAKFYPRKRALSIRRDRTRGLYRAYRQRRARRLKHSAEGFSRRYPKIAHPAAQNRSVRVISCPIDMNLDANYIESLNTVNDIRYWGARIRDTPFYVDFRPIRTITPAAALLIAAELDRWNELHFPKKLCAVDVKEWDPSVRQLLDDMGFFTLLRIEDQSFRSLNGSDDGGGRNRRFLPFQSGHSSDGTAAAKLKDQIESFAGHLKDRYSLYDGLVEAMTNVVHHAYPQNGNNVRKWWISASVDKDDRRLTILCLDHGVGIPATLPRKNLEAIRGIISRVGPGLLKDDARMIEAAVELERSSTGKAYRGHGLKRDIQRYVETHDSSAYLRIISNHGTYLYEKGQDEDKPVSLSNNGVAHQGTLIEWMIEDYAEVGSADYQHS